MTNNLGFKHQNIPHTVSSSKKHSLASLKKESQTQKSSQSNQVPENNNDKIFVSRSIFRSISQACGGDIHTSATLLLNTLNTVLDIITDHKSGASLDLLAKEKGPSIKLAIQSVIELREKNRTTPFFNRLNVLSEGILGLGFVFCPDFVFCMSQALESCLFWANKIWIEHSKESEEGKWVTALIEIFKSVTFGIDEKSNQKEKKDHVIEKFAGSKLQKENFNKSENKICNLVGNNWIVKGQSEMPEPIKILPEQSQSVFVSNSSKILVLVTGKPNAISILNVENAEFSIDSAISCVEIINSKKISVVITDLVPSILVERSSDVTLNLSERCLDPNCRIYTSCISSLCVNIPKGDDFMQLPVPDQFVHYIKDGQVISEANKMFI